MNNNATNISNEAGNLVPTQELSQTPSQTTANGAETQPLLNKLDRSSEFDQQLATLFSPEESATTPQRERMTDRQESQAPSQILLEDPINPDRLNSRDPSVMITGSGNPATTGIEHQPVQEQTNRIERLDQATSSLVDMMRALFTLYLNAARASNVEMAVEVLNQAIRTQAMLETAVGTDRMRNLCENWNPRTDLTALEVNQRQMNQAQQHQQNPVNSAPTAPVQNAHTATPFYQAPY
ncbi:hypothetical protein PGT21_014851 [Puccinia graminis f. sp. tritici]|uniref:Uncharacterized protein n=1 Tax=Puccinia graminis f. sp. tritici TaxID=56615 RepID=A0A5B0LPP5_PUCGR|nr:hypothetical protein PGT21_014851 [Puccinia graminis f. sp. tritici]KAA1130561.1 hypothetical protein PGTUg99_022509 [Puccinia graminis f. sp. tritici]